MFSPLKIASNPICKQLALLGTHHIFHVSSIRANTIVGVFFPLFSEEEVPVTQAFYIVVIILSWTLSSDA